jgi:pimeloyl-ACP methyl ester carboxylesterase
MFSRNAVSYYYGSKNSADHRAEALTMKSHLLNIVRTGNGPTLVLIHGISGSHRIWDRLLPFLEDDFTLVAIDLLGYGHSPKPHIAYTPEAHIEAIHATLQHHAIKPPYTLIGLSMGANLALAYLARWPEECGGFIGIGLPYYPDEAAAHHALHHNLWTRLALEHQLFAQVFTPTVFWLGRHHILPAEKFFTIYSPAMARETLLNPYYVFRSCLLNCIIHNPQEVLLRASGELPRLFIQGSEDNWTNIHDVVEALSLFPKSIFKVIPRVEHNTVVIAPKETAKLIRAYLDN